MENYKKQLHFNSLQIIKKESYQQKISQQNYISLQKTAIVFTLYYKNYRNIDLLIVNHMMMFKYLKKLKLFKVVKNIKYFNNQRKQIKVQQFVIIFVKDIQTIQHIIDSEFAIAFTCSHVFHDYCVLKGFYKIPFKDTCESEISYKIQKERVLKQYMTQQKIQESKFLQQMSVNKITLVTNQQHQQQIQQARIDKKSILKRLIIQKI